MDPLVGYSSAEILGGFIGFVLKIYIAARIVIFVVNKHLKLKKENKE